MYIVSDAIKNVLSRSSRQFTASFFVGTKEYNEIKTFSIEGGSTADEIISIGDTVSACLNMTVITSDNLDNKAIVLYVYVKMDDDSYDSILMGHFKVTSAKAKGSAVEVVAGGTLSTNCEMPFFSELTYPTSAVSVLNEISSKASVTINTAGLSTTLMVETKPEGYTYREVIGYIAAMFGRYATEERNGSISLKWYESNSTDIFTDKIGEPELEQSLYTVSKLTCKTSDDTDLTRGTGTLGITISNPIMTNAAMDVAWNNIKDFSYQPGTIEVMSANPCVDVWDCFLYDSKNIICAKYTLTYDGGIKANISSTGKAESEVSYQGPLTRQMERFYADIVLINEALVNKLTVDEADIRYLQVSQLDVIEANIEAAVINNLEADFADIHLANIDIADVGTFFANSGIISSAVIENGHVTGYLSSVKINADVIDAGTLKVDRLLVTGEDSIVYQINVNSSGLSMSELSDEKYQSYLNGTDIVANSITANQIAAGTITANEIAAAGIKAKNIDTIDLFAQDITASGTITGATLVGTNAEITEGKIGKFEIVDGLLSCHSEDSSEDATALSLVNGPLELTDWSQHRYSSILKTRSLTFSNEYIDATSNALTTIINKIEPGQITLSGYLPVAGRPTFDARITTNEAQDHGLGIFCDAGIFLDGGSSTGILVSSMKTTSGADLDVLNSNLLKHNLLVTHSTASQWSGPIGLSNTTIIEIAVLNSSNFVVASQVISVVVAKQSSSASPYKIYSGSTIVAQFHVDGSNRLYLFNYAGYKSKVYC